MTPRGGIVLALLLGGALLAFGAWRAGGRPAEGTPIEAAAFRMLPWSRVVGPPGDDGTWRVPLRPAPLGVRVLSRSCGCLGAVIERRGTRRALVLRLAADRRPVRIRVVLGFSDARGGRARRTLDLVPRYPAAGRACVPLPVHVVARDAARGHAFAQVRLDAEMPPRLTGDPGLALATWRSPLGGWRVLVHGFVPPDLVEPGRLMVDGVDIPLRAFRRVR